MVCFSLNFLPFTMLLHFFLKKICAKFASATTKNAGETLAFALHLASKRIAFSTKLHCNLHQNARLLAPKRKQKTWKSDVKGCL